MVSAMAFSPLRVRRSKVGVPCITSNQFICCLLRILGFALGFLLGGYSTRINALVNHYLVFVGLGSCLGNRPSWRGAKGYAEVWLNPGNDWIYPHLDMAAERMVELARRFERPSDLERRVAGAPSWLRAARPT